MTDTPYREAAQRPAAKPDAYVVAWAKWRKRGVVGRVVAFSGVAGGVALMGVSPAFGLIGLLAFTGGLAFAVLFPCPKCGEHRWEPQRGLIPHSKLRCSKCGLAFGVPKGEA